MITSVVTEWCISCSYLKTLGDVYEMLGKLLSWKKSLEQVELIQDCWINKQTEGLVPFSYILLSLDPILSNVM